MPVKDWQQRLWWIKQGQSLTQKLWGKRIQIKEIHVLLPLVWITLISECSSYIFFVWTVKTTSTECFPMQFGWAYFVWIIRWGWGLELAGLYCLYAFGMPVKDWQQRLWWIKQGQSLTQKLWGKRIQIKEIHVLLPLVWITLISECSSYVFFVWTVKTTSTECFPMQFGWAYFVWIIRWGWEHPGRSSKTVNPTLFQGIIHVLVCSKIKFCLLTFKVTFNEQKRLNSTCMSSDFKVCFSVCITL